MGKQGENKSEYSVSELAEKYDASRRIVLGWIQRKKFPNARMVTPPVGKPYWIVSASDLENFEKPVGRGRPLSDNPSDDAIRKRKKRKEQNK